MDNRSLQAPVPRRVAHFLRTYPRLGSEPVLDVGCGVLTPHLRHFGPGSIGLDGAEVEPPDRCHFVRWNFSSDIPTLLDGEGLPRAFEFVWCQDVFEHVLSPHEFLLNLRRALRPDGLLFLGVPLINRLGPLADNRRNPLNYFRGFLSQDHVNFFTFRTLKYTVEFAGLELRDWYSPFFKGWKRPPRFGIEPVVIMVLSPVPGFEYGPKAAKVLVDGRLHWKGFIAKE